MTQIPLFPLNTVLYPGGPLQLRIFEPRYLELVSDCLRHGNGFGVCLIRTGAEVGPAPVPRDVGTLGRISDWEQRRDGLLGITVIGERRFRLRELQTLPSQLLLGEVEYLEQPARTALPERFQPLTELLRRIVEQLDGPYDSLPTAYDEAGWVSYRLAEILPLPLAAKQELLEQDDPLGRLERIERLISRKAGA